MSKIVVLASFAPSLISFRGEMLRKMVNMGHKVIACSPPPVGSDILPFLDSIGVEFQQVDLERTGMNPLKDMVNLISLTITMRKIRPDIFLGYTIKPVIFGSLAARFAGVPNIYSMVTGLGNTFSRNSLKGKSVAALARFLYKCALKFNNKVLFQNPDDQSFFIKNRLVNKKTGTVLINGSGVDIDYYSPAPLPGQISFLMVARLVLEKGVREYVEAARRLKERHPDVRFCLVGMLDDNPHGVTQDELNSWVASGNIDYLGEMSDVRPAYSDASVFVLPSFYGEGTPRTVLEAMSMGRPIITTDAPGCRETVIPGKNGYLVPVKDVDGLVTAMKKMILKPDIIPEMGRASREIAEKKYDVHKVNAIIVQSMDLNNNGV